MFTLLSGRMVHEGETGQHVVALAMTERPQSLAAVLPTAAPEIVALVDGALAFEKTERWGSAEALRTAIRQAHRALFGGTPDLRALTSDDLTHVQLHPRGTEDGGPGGDGPDTETDKTRAGHGLVLPNLASQDEGAPPSSTVSDAITAPKTAVAPVDELGESTTAPRPRPQLRQGPMAPVTPEAHTQTHRIVPAFPQSADDAHAAHGFGGHDALSAPLSRHHRRREPVQAHGAVRRDRKTRVVVPTVNATLEYTRGRSGADRRWVRDADHRGCRGARPRESRVGGIHRRAFAQHSSRCLDRLRYTRQSRPDRDRTHARAGHRNIDVPNRTDRLGIIRKRRGGSGVPATFRGWLDQSADRTAAPAA